MSNNTDLKFSQQLTIAIISGLIGTVLGAIITGVVEIHKVLETSKLERQKYEYSLIQKAIESRDEKEAATRLNFLIEIDAITSLNRNAIKKFINNPGTIPNYSFGVVKPSDENTWGYPDYDVFLCDIQSKNTQALQEVVKVIDSIKRMPRVGEIRFREWKNYAEIPLEKIKNKTTVVIDEYEKTEISNLQKQLGKDVQILNQTGEETKWRLSIILCPIIP